VCRTRSSATRAPNDLAINDQYPIELQALEQSDPDVWEAINPYSHLGRHPELIVRLIQGVDDDVSPFDVPPYVSEGFFEALSHAGYDVELTLVDGASHSIGLTGNPQFDAIVAQTMAVAAR
jgi:dipeptidyl aminopeptidase/acylaminoacyl peptidase